MLRSVTPSFRLAEPEGDGQSPYLNGDGAFLGPGVPLLEKDVLGRWRPRPRAVLEKLLGLGYGAPVSLAGHMGRLAAVARALAQGDIGLAGIALVQARLPPLPDASSAERMAKADGVFKYSPDQPRVAAGSRDGGEWTSGGDAARSRPARKPRARQISAPVGKPQAVSSTHRNAHPGTDQRPVDGPNTIVVNARYNYRKIQRELIAVTSSGFQGIKYSAKAGAFIAVQRTIADYVKHYLGYDGKAGSAVFRLGSDVDLSAYPSDNFKKPIGTTTRLYPSDANLSIAAIQNEAGNLTPGGLMDAFIYGTLDGVKLLNQNQVQLGFDNFNFDNEAGRGFLNFSPRNAETQLQDNLVAGGKKGTNFKTIFLRPSCIKRRIISH